MIQNYSGVDQEHEKKGEEECANWLLSVVMDGSRIISLLGLLWGSLWSVYKISHVFFTLGTHTHTHTRSQTHPPPPPTAK